MAPHERNPICIKDSEHLAELIKVRFDASDARQEEIKKQVVYTNGRTRKLEDYHLEQIAINREMLESLMTHKKHSAEMALELESIKESVSDISRRPSITVFLQKNWVATITIIISIIAIFASITSNSSKDESDTEHKQTNTNKYSKVDSYTNGYTTSRRNFSGSYTLFGVH